MEYCQTIEEIVHPAVREVLRFLNFDRGLEIHHDGDLPARSGMGSSSAFTVGLLHALYALKGHMATKKQLASESIHIEQDLLQETVGSQDQVLAAYGGLNQITFLPNDEVSVTPITIQAERRRELNDHLMLFYTGIKRTASNVAESYVNGIGERKRQLRIMKDLVDESVSILNSGQDIRGFGPFATARTARRLARQRAFCPVDQSCARRVNGPGRAWGSPRQTVGSAAR
jgi:D-glycero-alpha-D-manno-heptose-7-phosphate kinase